MHLIPAIDLKSGHCVRLLRGDFAQETRYPGEPAQLARKYRDCGAGWLHVVDLDGARDGALGNRAAIEALAATRSLDIQVGGGLRDLASVEHMFELGAARAVIGSAALTHTAEVRAWIGRFGAQRIALAFDVRLDADGVPCVATHGWLKQSRLCIWDALEPYSDAGLRHVLCTDVGRDGALCGPNVALYREAARRHPRIEWQASGGIRDAHDLHALALVGAAAAISGKALLEDLIPAAELAPFWPNA